MSVNYTFYKESKKINKELNDRIVNYLNGNIDIDSEIYYHLSDIKKDIFNVCDIQKSDDVLLIGAGYGVYTKALLELANNVTILEDSKQICMINDLIKNDRLSIYAGNICNFKIKCKFNKIFILGDLGYANSYFSSANSYQNYLNKVKELLASNGTLFIACENKYAMRYFSGAKPLEGDYFSSIEGKGEYQLLSNFELRSIISKCGLQSFFYYPLPEYQLPKVMYSEVFLPNPNELYDLGHSYDSQRYVIFNEEKALNEALTSMHFETFTNAFFIKCW